MPVILQGSHPARAVEPTPRLRALCVENNAAMHALQGTLYQALPAGLVVQLVTQKNAKTE
ncbi:hypothetical protein J8M20_07180 [Pseudoalteromonas luteoviolacea]|uniref:hypothetical protein n=1 Tax=Pseudoalteromonas luteoviolacea TaxID=43657 RepID=UPI001B37C686|nr:hypothetical protein [Pseudoalteromonas luteoviolacea]MBQ4811112.1 hypothetical protein [Pseudoalteromonas luteoviolacea]